VEFKKKQKKKTTNCHVTLLLSSLDNINGNDLVASIFHKSGSNED